MSSILLSNPFVAPTPVATSPQDPVPVTAVAPTQSTHSARSSGDSASYSGSGSGSGQSNQGDTVALLQTGRTIALARPTDATSGSVVNAQDENTFQPVTYGSNLPAVEMPDPLPTSPFLKLR